MEEGLGEADALFETLREGFNGLLADRREVGEADGAVDLGAPSGGGAEAADLGDEAEEFLDGHLGVGGGALGEIAELSFYGDGVDSDIDAIDGGGAGIRAKEAGDHLHRGGLAGAVGAEEAKDVTAVDTERDAIHGAFGTVGFYEAFDFNHGEKWERESGN